MLCATRGVVLAAGLAALSLEGCGGGGGGPAPLPVVPPPPPTTAPPPPAVPPAPPPTVVGENRIGGQVWSDGHLTGEFGGQLTVSGLFDGRPFMGNGTASRPGSPGYVGIAVDPASTGEPAVTITLVAAPPAYTQDLGGRANFEDAETHTVGGGLVTVDVVKIDDSRTMARIDFDLGGRTPSLGALFGYVEVADAMNFITTFTSVGADQYAGDPAAPATATFDTGVFGVFARITDRHPQDFVSDSFFGRGTVTADFRAGTVTGAFDDVDFIRGDSSVSEASAAGVDFGLAIDAHTEGGEFRGLMTATGANMSGPIEGSFYGPASGAATEIGGAFTIGGRDGEAIGGLAGVEQ